MKILIAEDSLVARKLLRQQLTPLGEIDVAENGEEVINAVEIAFKKDSQYELIILDIGMPVVDGIQALKKIRDMEARQGLDQKKRSKIIMVTAHSNKNKVIAAGHSNCDAYLIKPVTKPRLLEELNKLGFDTLAADQE